MTAPRILNPYAKFLYGFVGYLVLLMLNLVVAALVGPVVGPLLFVVLFFAWIVIGARLFRVPEEPVAPPRPWWKLTARPTAGFVIAALLGLQALAVGSSALLAGAVAEQVGQPGLGASTTQLTAAVAFVVAAAAYLGSSLTLRRVSAPGPSPAGSPS
ncbi:hypothetical protein NVV95_12985 [Herbiconiux sp. CPCC 205716]|uniref:Transmembrane protein n=1 Tax=Herbiconiux gentiana TaxID=2970912 RepID=A0ABT2GGV7_9MICO|nr:hypothetical protein [Herbiconiux gentiana]MCS5715458.1 hypothetical protein [Herbiconiux gentiana]